MGFKDLMNSATNAAKNKATSMYEEKKADVQQSIELSSQKKELARSRKDQFNAVRIIGEVSLDDVNHLFKVKNATGEVKKSHVLFPRPHVRPLQL